MKRKIFLVISLIFLCFPIFANPRNDTQIIKSGHWIYDSLYMISSAQKQSFFMDNQPMSIGEMKFYFNQIDYQELTEAGKREYEKIKDFLYNVQSFFPKHEGRIFVNCILNPEVYYKTNSDIDWSFDYYLNDHPFTLPVILGFSNFVTLEPDFYVGMNYYYLHNNPVYTNIPLSGEAFEFLSPRFAYGSFGQTFEKWGWNVHAGKEGLTIGNTQLGSIIYNKTFETDYYVQVNLFTDYFKYNLDVAQVDTDKFLYLHQTNFRPFKCFKFGCIEGSLLNSSFELRYLNPLMTMHSFGSWTQYESLMNKTEYEAYGEGHFCAYLNFNFEWMPFRNFRLYGYYAQNEILDMGGSRSLSALSMPDSLGFQLGGEYNFNLEKGYIKTNLESIYTSPYLYVKQSPEWSLYKTRNEMQNDGTVTSWIGSPFGPDCFATVLSGTYYSQDKWQVSLSYLFKIHGENTAENLFNPETNKVRVDENGKVTEDDSGISIWNFYPWVKYWIADKKGDEEGMIAAKDLARNMWMHGVSEYTNQITVKGQYAILNNLTVYGKFVYSFIFNNNNIQNNFAQGVEFSAACEYKLFN